MSAFEFWGIEVKPGESVKCEPGGDRCLHLSQASLGEVKKDNWNENIVINLKFNNQKLVIGTLSADKCPQMSYDLVFEKEFELSHNWKNGGVFFVGYIAFAGDEEPDGLTGNNDSESEDEDVPVKEDNGGNEGEGDSDDEDGDEDESSEEEDEETPKNVDGKKRPLGSASKIPAPEKKAKLVTPVGSQKTGGGADGKRGGHTTTPYPAKHAGKTPATNDKSKQKSCNGKSHLLDHSVTWTFRDGTALQLHTKAKHAAK